MKINKENYMYKNFNSTKYGYYTIINDLDFINNRHMVEIKFHKSEAKSIVELTDALSGAVRDPLYGVNLNKIYLSDNYGPYKILEVIKGKSHVPTKAIIKFINTEFIDTVFLSHALNGDIKDKTLNIKIPIDTFMLDDDDRFKRIERIARQTWHEMHKRCTNKNAQNYNMYGGEGVSVCDRWNNFNTFLLDIQSLPQYYKWYRYPTIYQLDKDYLQLSIPKNKRIYSPETCMFLHYLDNINLMNIDNKNNLTRNSENKYFGVAKQSSNTYSAMIRVNNKNIYLGTYDDEMVAANVYNYWSEYFHNYDIVPLKNNVPFIPKEEFIKHNTKPKEFCKMIERKEEL